MKNRNIIITIIAASLVFACSEKEQAPAPTGSVKLGYRVDQVQLKSGFAGDTAILASKPKQLVITVHDSNGKPVLNGERYDLIKIGDEYYSKSILFKTGEYTLEEFIVIDSTDEAMYVAPKTGSRLAGFVDDPLPQSFEVQKESESEVKVQVVPAYLASASDFGYASFPFEVIIPSDVTDYDLHNIWVLKGIFYINDSIMVHPPEILEFLGREIYIVFMSNNSVFAQSSCNQFHGDFTVMPPDSINIDISPDTKLLCTGVVEEWEHIYHQELNNASNYQITGNQLIIKSKSNIYLIFKVNDQARDKNY
jgi:hypothetical protein